MKPESVIERRLEYKSKIVSYSDVLKHIRNKDHIVVISAESGMGKTTLLGQLMTQLNQNHPQINIVKIPEIGKEGNKFRSYIEEGKKNVVGIDNISRFPN